MPEVRSTDWSQVKLRCTVIMIQHPAHIRVHVHHRDIELDDEVFHWDYFGCQVSNLLGRDITLRASLLPEDFVRTNAEFWIAHDNAIIPRGQHPVRFFYRNESDDSPAAVVTTSPDEWP